MVRRILIFIIICIIVSCKLNAQFDPQFSHNMFNMLAVNPAYAGTEESINLVGLYRNQWAGGIEDYVFSGDMPMSIFRTQAGVGLNIMEDEIGYFKNISIIFNYSYAIELEKGTLSMGLKLGVLSQSLDGDWVLPEDVYDDSDPTLVTSEEGSAFDSGLGIYYHNTEWYGGISLTHLNKPKTNFEDLDYVVGRTLYVTGGYNYKIKETSYELLPSFFFKTDGASSQIDLNTLVRYRKRIWGGLTYRFQDAIVVFAGLELKNGIRFGYSYDITTSALASANYGGSHEIMFGYNLNINFEKRTKRYKSVRYL